MKTKRHPIRTGIVIIVLVGIVYVVHAFMQLMRFNHSYVPSAMRITWMLQAFAATHDGRLPANKQELLDEHFLNLSDDSQVQFVKTNPEDEQENEMIVHIDDFIIAYGVALNNLEQRDYRLFDKTTGQPAYLINGPDGPHLSWNEKNYMRLSLDIYNDMKKYYSD